MKKDLFIILIIVVIAGIGGIYVWSKGKISNPTPSIIGGSRDDEGCLISAGYAFDEEVGACIKGFEMTPDIKRAAKLAVDSIGRENALTVANFNSYEEPGAYDIFFERGIERIKEVVYIRDWKVEDVEATLSRKLSECKSLENNSTKTLNETSRIFINLPRDLYDAKNIIPLFTTISGNPSVGVVSNGGIPGEAMESTSDCYSTYVEFDGKGEVELNVKSLVQNISDYSVKFVIN